MLVEGEEEEEDIYDARDHANPYIPSTTVLSDIQLLHVYLYTALCAN